MKIRSSVSVALGIFLLVAMAPPAYADDAPGVVPVPTQAIQIDSGKVRGERLPGEPGVNVFRGLPFAAPPQGDLRWRPPEPVEPWTEVRDCTEFGPACPQPAVSYLEEYPGWELNAPQSEDCLYLNVWTPAQAPTAPLPVMVWIHGGGYALGSGSQGLYDGQYLARQGVVVVTFNYRLGALGYLAHPVLSAESLEGVSGNYGLRDQIAALQWVRKNIGAFGGDPDRVTVFGQSAGGGSIWALLASPAAEGLFQRAITQSATTLYMKHLKESRYGYASMERIGIEFASSLGIADGPDALSKLRALTPQELLAASPSEEVVEQISFTGDFLKFAPIVDGHTLPDDPWAAFDAGKQHPVPLILGANSDEGTMFSITADVPPNVDKYLDLMQREFGGSARSIVGHYPPGDASDIMRSVGELYKDFVFIAPTRRVARAWEKRGLPVYLYRFTLPPAGSIGEVLGAHHGAEIAYVFANPSYFDPEEARAEDPKLLEAMSGYWVRFAKGADPEEDEDRKWPRYSGKKGRHMEFGSSIKVRKKSRQKQYDDIDAFVAQWERP